MSGAFGGEDIDWAHLALRFSFLPKPTVMIHDAHKHNFNQFLYFVFVDSDDFTAFDADAKLTLDGTVTLITCPS